MSSIKHLLASTCVAALLAVPARAHDDGRLHLHVNGAALHADEVAAAPAGVLSSFARVPAPVWGVASLAVAATLLRRKRTARA